MRAAKYDHEAPTSRDVAGSAALVSAGAFGAYLVFLGVQLRRVVAEVGDDVLYVVPAVGTLVRWVAFFCIPLAIFWFSRRAGTRQAPGTATRRDIAGSAGFARLVRAVMGGYLVIVVAFFWNCFWVYAEIPEHLKR